MSTNNQPVRTAEDFAKNYSFAPEGISGPYTIGHISRGVVTPTKNGGTQKRVIVNIRCKTAQSKDKGAAISYPESKDWEKQYLALETGQLTNIEVENGYIKRLVKLQIQKPITAKEMNARMAAQQAEQAKLAEDAANGEGVFEGAAKTDAATDDLPF